MTKEGEAYYSINDIVKNIVDFGKYLLGRWLLFLLSLVVGVLIGVFFYFQQKPKYEAETSFILDDKSSSGGGGLAGLASQFGFNVGSLTGNDIFSGDNILYILKSKRVVQEVLLSAVDSSSSKTLADAYLEFMGFKKRWAEKSRLETLSFANSRNVLSPIQDSILNNIYEAIIKKNLVAERASKQGTIINVHVTAPDCLFARLMTERLVDEASKMYLNIRVGTAQENIKQLQKRSDSLLILLNSKSYAAASSQPLDVNPGIKTAIVPLEIASRDKTVLATLYAEVTKNLEASKLLLSQQTPVIQLLDHPGYLLEDNKKSLPFLVIISSITTMACFVLALYLRYAFRSSNLSEVNATGNSKFYKSSNAARSRI
jgi:hypothetical protein